MFRDSWKCRLFVAPSPRNVDCKPCLISRGSSSSSRADGNRSGPPMAFAAEFPIPKSNRLHRAAHAARAPGWEPAHISRRQTLDPLLVEGCPWPAIRVVRDVIRRGMARVLRHRDASWLAEMGRGPLDVERHEQFDFLELPDANRVRYHSTWSGLHSCHFVP